MTEWEPGLSLGFNPCSIYQSHSAPERESKRIQNLAWIQPLVVLFLFVFCAYPGTNNMRDWAATVLSAQWLTMYRWAHRFRWVHIHLCSAFFFFNSTQSKNYLGLDCQPLFCWFICFCQGIKLFGSQVPCCAKLTLPMFSVILMSLACQLNCPEFFLFLFI